MPRRPGQKEQRYLQLLGGAGEAPAEPDAPAKPPAPDHPGGPDRLDRLEAEVAELRDQVAALRREFGV
jgi:uncharacterized protein YceH (UPF0502 family)